MCVPFSHHTRRGPSRDDYSHHEIPILAPAGSAVLFVSGMWHRQGANTSEDEHRMAANADYTPIYWKRESAFTPPARLSGSPRPLMRVRLGSDHCGTCRRQALSGR